MSKNFFSGKWLIGILLIVSGILFCVCKGQFLQFIIIGAGVLFLIQAVIDFCQKMTFFGVLEAVGGVIIILCGSLILAIALYIVGALLIGAGVLAIVRIREKSIRSLIMSIGAVVLGIMLIITQMNNKLDWLYIVIGVLSILGGVSVFIKDKTE